LIRGYRAIVDAAALGKPITAFIRLTVSSVTTDYVESKQRVMDICGREPDVLECHGVAGDDCYILKVRATSPQDLESLLERIRSVAPISKSTTSIVLSTFKEETLIVPAGGSKVAGRR
ncbi:MAG: Lrp/AsnC family transcriptional regulator, partial [Anaerolineae bacterium]|nr:Lrp/AsnC family transcriptional regulator [Anaerolineae bacterium]